MKMKRRRGSVGSVGPVGPVGSVDEHSVSDDTALLDGSDGSGNGAHDEDAAYAGDSAHNGSGTNGAGDGHSKSSGSTAIMLPKRRRRLDSAPVSAVAPVVEDEVDAVVEAPPARSLLPRRRKAMLAETDVEVAPAAAPIPAAPVASAPRRKVISGEGGMRVFLTYQNIFWASLFILTVVTRLWDLGSRGIHHDESLHANFSYVLYDGRGYIHDPMMHGPLQFHLIAAMFWLFGATDATARFASVACGIFVVMSPFFLRRQMGQIAAMVCGALLFISPSVLYFSRMAREDAIFSGMEMIMLVGLWRFVSERKPTDFVVFCAGLALMFTIKETSYLTLLILVGFFLVTYAIQAGYAALGALGGFGAAFGALYLFVNSGMKSGSIPPLPDIPQVSPDFDTIWRYMGALFTHPLVYGALILTTLFLVGMGVLMWSQRGPSRPAFVAGGVSVRRAVPGNGVPTRRIADNSTNGRESVENVTSSGEPVGIDDPIEDDDASPVYDPREMNPSPGSASARYQPGSVPHLIGSLFAPPPGYKSRTLGQLLAFTGRTFLITTALFPALLIAYYIAYYIAYFTVRFALSAFFPLLLGTPPAIEELPRYLLNSLFIGLIASAVAAVIIPLFMRFRTLMAGLLVAATIYITLYTVFFTDIPRGLISGPFGSLGYWMAQHDVVRGDQPWYFYLLLIPLYEPVAAFFALVGIIFFTWLGARWLFRRVRGDVEPGEPLPQRLGLFNTERPVPLATIGSFLPAFIMAWLLGTLFIYSWAGEKMPWLMMHMVRPAIFLASLFLGALIVSLIRRRRERLIEAGLDVEANHTPLIGTPSRRQSPAFQSSRERKSPLSAITGALDKSMPNKRGSLALAGASSFVAPSHTVAMASMAPRGSSMPPPSLPPRRRAGGKTVEQPVYATQEPPWVTWSRPGSRFPFVSYVIIFVLLTLGWGLKMNAVTYFTRYEAEWGWTWAFPLAILLATIVYAVWLGPGRAFRYLAMGILTVGLMYQFRSAINLSYNQPDVPIEMATYVQTSPHVVDVVRNLETFADLVAPGVSYPAGAPAGPKKNLKVMYDEFTSWPMEWYLREYDKTFIGDGEATPGEDVPVLLLEWAQHNNKPNLTDKYVGIQYPMRWWFPEEWYKEEFIPNRFLKGADGSVITDPESKRQDKRKESPLLEQAGGALNTIRATVTEPQLQATLWKYLIFRETPKPLGSQDMILYVRKDVAPLWNRIQYEPSPPSTDVLPRALPDREWWLTDVVDRD